MTVQWKLSARSDRLGPGLRSIRLMVLLAGVALGMPTMAGVPSTNDVLKKYDEANTLCRGGAGKETMAWCAIRDGLGYVLNFRNLCYGKQDQAGFEMQWHRCGSDSIRPEIPESVRYE